MHWWRLLEDIKIYKEIGETEEFALKMWFNGASDHLDELEIPEQFKDKKIGKLVEYIKEKGLRFGHGFQEKPTKKDFDDIFDKLKELAMLIDKEFGIKDINAEYE